MTLLYLGPIGTPSARVDLDSCSRPGRDRVHHRAASLPDDCDTGLRRPHCSGPVHGIGEKRIVLDKDKSIAAKVPQQLLSHLVSEVLAIFIVEA